MYSLFVRIIPWLVFARLIARTTTIAVVKVSCKFTFTAARWFATKLAFAAAAGWSAAELAFTAARRFAAKFTFTAAA
jgi:hypothetical protein